MTWPVWSQMTSDETRDATWRWVKEHFDASSRAVSKHHGRPQVIALPSGFCDEAHPRTSRRSSRRAPRQIDGAPRVLASTLEEIRLCVAKRRAEEPSAREFFAKQKR